jgi:hypothetical protein
VSGHLRALTALPLEKEFPYPLDRRLGGARNQSGNGEDSQPYEDFNSDPSLSSPQPIAIPTALFCLCFTTIYIYAFLHIYCTFLLQLPVSLNTVLCYVCCLVLCICIVFVQFPLHLHGIGDNFTCTSCYKVLTGIELLLFFF